MFKATLLVSFLFLSSAFAANPVYKLNINLTLNGKHVASQGLIVNHGEKSEIQQKSANGTGSFIEVTPEEIDGELKKVHLKFTVGVIAKGVRQILSTPEMIVSEGKAGTIEVGEDDGPENFTLTVLANRQPAKK
ncbi:hypothetical protein [Pseudobdellovibrio sp. HCB154]|uniref:hypothetical protein n=1 Tax=Pseudobdellovibrio sp. HCB154 TaxID=3386277 RepID=UPI003917309D